MKLDIGSGYGRKDGFKRADIDPDVKPDFLCEADNLTEICDGEVEEAHAFHVLEHLPERKTFGCLREWWRILKSGGVLHLKVPDVGSACKDWVEGKSNDCCFVKAVLGADPTASQFMPHLNLFWEGRLRRFLSITGFTKIEQQKGGWYELYFTAVKP